MPPAQSVRFLPVLAVVGVTSCGATGPGGSVTGPELEGRIALHNGSTRDAWYAFTRRCGVAVWGEDELGPSVVLRPGQSAAWTERAGCYDLLVLSNPRVEPQFEAQYQQRLVVADQQTAIAIADQDWSPMAHDPESAAPMP
jgi:hypothetical protein